jgi:hypothetical protein
MYRFLGFCVVRHITPLHFCRKISPPRKRFAFAFAPCLRLYVFIIAQLARSVKGFAEKNCFANGIFWQFLQFFIKKTAQPTFSVTPSPYPLDGYRLFSSLSDATYFAYCSSVIFGTLLFLRFPIAISPYRRLHLVCTKKDFLCRKLQLDNRTATKDLKTILVQARQEERGFPNVSVLGRTRARGNASSTQYCVAKKAF